ncbi:GCN5 family acetyltransferase [Terrabacter sp. Root85]|uniref:GNAT family N-acetyltransferase n=1 Tax=Terrabacter sp. Root85 TaxID=1736603 RepID=UPI000701E0D1|nr:GNAT family N-acetyltransferase [Terrabacter sp. Root85]KRC92991.1 GCN5 family acetyltransferase [Terrabacter sp. Root85]
MTDASQPPAVTSPETSPETPPETPPVTLLTDGVVTLRAHSVDDADAIVDQSRDPESLRWTTVPRPYAREDALGWVEHNLSAWGEPRGTRSWAIAWTDATGTPRYAGTIDLRPGAAPSAGELGFGLHPDARGHGLMSRAVRLVVAHAFATPVWGAPVTRVHWRAVVGNWGSRRTAWSTGFTFHGTLPGSHPDPEGGTEALDTWTASITPGVPLEPQAPWFAAVQIDGERVRLRPWRAEDVDAIEPRDDPGHWMPSRSILRPETFPAWLRTRQERMSEGTAVDWCVADLSTDRALGSVTVFSRGGAITDTAELGYQFFPSARGRGAAKEAARLAVDHALAPASEGGLGVRRLVAETAADNEASNGVLRSVGFVEFGREHAVDRVADGGWGDGLHWELLPPGSTD